MSFNFNTNGSLFCKGETSVIQGTKKLDEIVRNISSIKTPKDFDVNKILSLKYNIDTLLEELEDCVDVIFRTKEQLLKVDSNFYNDYMNFFNNNNILIKMDNNEQLNFMDYLMRLVLSYDSLDENTKFILRAYFGEHITKVSYSGIFKDFTDFQNINMAGFSNVFHELEQDKQNVEGKTIKELLCTKKYKNDKSLEKLYKRGYGDIKIVEIIRGQSGFSAITLQDKTGNYMINFNCTETEGENAKNDFYYDAALALNTEFGYHVRSFSNIIFSSFIPFIPVMTEPTITIFNYKYVIKQREQAHDVTQKYIDAVKGTDKKISISGYSLGGSLAEEALLYCDKNGRDCVDKVVLFNPIHNALSKKDIEIIKSYGDKYQCYAAQGDMVSALSNYDDLKDVTRYIGYDYEAKYNEICESSKNVEFDFLNIIVGTTHAFGTVSNDDTIINNNFDDKGCYMPGASPVSLSDCLMTVLGGFLNE